jgi:hypothetical protein
MPLQKHSITPRGPQQVHGYRVSSDDEDAGVGAVRQALKVASLGSGPSAGPDLAIDQGDIEAVGSRRRKRCKDGKNKRDRYRRLRDAMMNSIEAAPDDFEFENEALPDYISKDEWLKTKLLARLKAHQEEFKKKRALVSL